MFLFFNNIVQNLSTLVELFTKRDVDGLPCIMKAISTQSVSCIELLLKRLKELNIDHVDKMNALQTPKNGNVFHIAAQVVKNEEIINIMSDYEMMDELADRPDNQGTTPLIVACKCENHLVARMLVEKKRAKIDHLDSNNNSPIYLATVAGSFQMLKLLLKGKS